MNYAKLLALFGVTCLPLFVSANYYTLPINEPGDGDISYTAWFDHDNSGNQQYYDSSNPDLDEYDQHHGTDFGTNGVEEKEIYAAEDGMVKIDGWENPSDHSQGYGYRTYLYHATSGQ